MTGAPEFDDAPDRLAADYSHLLGARGVNMYVHTTDTSLRLYQQPIPVRLREATFVLDGLLEHGAELDSKRVVTDTHGFSEVVMASASLVDKELAPRITRVHEQTLYKLDRGKVYAHLDPILKGTIKPHTCGRSGTTWCGSWRRSRRGQRRPR